MQKYLPELLKEINENPKLLETLRGDAALTLLFKHAFLPEFKFQLPEGDPPYKPDAAPIGMNPAILRQELKRLYVFCRTDIAQVRKEALFIQLLEAVHPTESEILLAVKDQTLHKKYPKITRKLAADNGFVPPLPVKEKAPKDPTPKK
jgi:hypothetical protein